MPSLSIFVNTIFRKNTLKKVKPPRRQDAKELLKPFKDTFYTNMCYHAMLSYFFNKISSNKKTGFVLLNETVPAHGGNPFPLGILAPWRLSIFFSIHFLQQGRFAQVGAAAVPGFLHSREGIEDNAGYMGGIFMIDFA